MNNCRQDEEHVKSLYGKVSKSQEPKTFPKPYDTAPTKTSSKSFDTAPNGKNSSTDTVECLTDMFAFAIENALQQKPARQERPQPSGPISSTSQEKPTYLLDSKQGILLRKDSSGTHKSSMKPGDFGFALATFPDEPGVVHTTELPNIMLGLLTDVQPKSKAKSKAKAKGKGKSKPKKASSDSEDSQYAGESGDDCESDEPSEKGADLKKEESGESDKKGADLKKGKKGADLKKGTDTSMLYRLERYKDGRIGFRERGGTNGKQIFSIRNPNLSKEDMEKFAKLVLSKLEKPGADAKAVADWAVKTVRTLE